MSWDRTWEKVFKENEWGKYPDENFIRFLARNFYKKDRKNIRILEIGCGPGANIWYMAREGFDVYGIDGSSIAIERARTRLKTEGCCRGSGILRVPTLHSAEDCALLKRGYVQALLMIREGAWE